MEMSCEKLLIHWYRGAPPAALAHALAMCRLCASRQHTGLVRSQSTAALHGHQQAHSVSCRALRNNAHPGVQSSFPQCCQLIHRPLLCGDGLLQVAAQAPCQGGLLKVWLPVLRCCAAPASFPGPAGRVHGLQWGAPDTVLPQAGCSAPWPGFRVKLPISVLLHQVRHRSCSRQSAQGSTISACLRNLGEAPRRSAAEVPGPAGRAQSD